MLERNRDEDRLNAKLDALSARLPHFMGRILTWLRNPTAKWVRIPVGILLVFFGFLGFLPILGFWMIPLGVLLLAQDIAFLRRPLLSAIVWTERTWKSWRR